MRKALIIGAAGFVGNYLIGHIQNNCIWSISVTKMKHEVINRQGIAIYDLDIMDKVAVQTLLCELRPDYIFHLAAQSSVALSWKNPGLTVDINIKGSLNVLDAVRDSGISARVLLIGSGEEYGHVHMEDIPIHEETVLRPGNIYAATKACQNMLGEIYSRAYGMDIIMVRAFNHVGPNQAPLFVVSDFCRQVADIEKGLKPPVIEVGNLSAKRDFSDVRDVVRAYTMLIEHGQSGETYNVGSGESVAIQDILDLILSFAKKEVVVEIDQARMRPVDVPIIEADITKLIEATGWKKQISLKQTIKEILNYWRNTAQEDCHG